ncbi:MAG: hypothetical protein ACREPW_04220 [Candidatus Binataceae bacterium]
METDFLDEVCSFPAAPHDDQVDVMSQALNYLREHDFPAFTYTGLLAYRHDPWARGSRETGVWGSCEAADRAEDMMGDATGFVTGGGADRMQMISQREIRAGGRWRSLARRRAW